jgi:hypothetical protein
MPLGLAEIEAAARCRRVVRFDRRRWAPITPGSPVPARRYAPTPDHIDIPLPESLVCEGDELIVESANPATYLMR